MVLLLATLLVGVAVAVGTQLKGEFVPSQDQGRILVRLQTPVGSNLAETDRIFQRAEAFLRTVPEVSRAFGVVGGFGGSGVNSGILFVTLTPAAERRRTQADLSDVVRREFNSYPGARAVVQDLSQAGFTGQRGFPVEFSVQGPDLDRLVELSEQLTNELRASGSVQDLDSNYEVGAPELEIRPDRARCADLGVSITDVAATINAHRRRSGGEVQLWRSPHRRPREARLQRTGTDDIEQLLDARSRDLVRSVRS